ncbi:EPHB3 [Symbiodinium necroappetens]|uniref:EPHB3 protein n=1 Tax=Symbiodinium necroappetens TaxID=1628268 RepID=A0A812IUG3_9DINO|nr:EPHB3 [Symbiodinium necroappetens]
MTGSGRQPVPHQPRPCPLSTYKSGQGSWPCARCPPGSQTNGTGRTSAEACMCHDTYYELRDASNKLLSCIPCPNNSGVVGFHRHRHEDCRCWHGFVREPASEDERLQYCRPAEPCNVSDLLSNLTGPEAYKLKMGSCEARANSSLLPDGLACSLACNAGFGAQLGSDIFRAVDLTLDCEDGTLVRRPPEGYLWCSEASWELPPLVFLGIATAATALGGAAIELRQHRLERRYAQALKPRPVPRPKRASSGASNDHSTGELFSLPNT